MSTDSQDKDLPMGIADAAFRLSTQGHARFYKATGGKLAGKNLLLLTTTGRRTGRERTTPLMRIEDGDNYVVAGSVGGAARHPGWYHNLIANPNVRVQVGRSVSARTARIARGEERQRLWAAFEAAEARFASYAAKTDRTIPVVVLEPADANKMIEPMEHADTPTRVEKPWGWELWWTVTDRYVGKVIFITAGNRLSLQYHNEKDESIFVVEGNMLLHLENDGGELEAIELGPGDFRRVPVGKRHRFEAVSDTRLIEVSTPELDDVVRLEDDFGREGTSEP